MKLVSCYYLSHLATEGAKMKLQICLSGTTLNQTLEDSPYVCYVAAYVSMWMQGALKS